MIELSLLIIIYFGTSLIMQLLLIRKIL